MKNIIALSVLISCPALYAAATETIFSPNRYIEALEKGSEDEAASLRALDMVQALEKGDDRLSSLYQGSTLLGWAAIYGNHEIVECLCAKGTDVNQRLRSKSTALHAAAVSGCPKTIGTLLAHGADPTLQDTAQLTPLHKALISEHSLAAITLINAGSPLNTRDNFGNTPLSLAQGNKLSDVVACIQIGLRLSTHSLRSLH